MSEEDWYTDGYNGGFVGDGGSRQRSGKKTKIPKFRSFIKNTNKRGRRRRVHANHDSETIIRTWTVILFVLSALFRTEIIFMLFYGIFILYTFISKNIGPIRVVSSTISAIGVVFFIAFTLFVVICLLGGDSLLQVMGTWEAYKYIIGVPLMSWGVVRLFEKWIYGN
ncbi:hypothetical protein CON42_21865 [Bacillus thuringiensis]|uniref:hypothetical protein n=1 Tax=Bacillus thuringiensis TaxID=1428 RepID=UPI000BEE6648|nr:hypothetical protein [Bacillus thuringiensis]MED3055997.1 hypothetical protein [Bacillus thuringiensis]PEA13398.1 hypothetical protein CON42_21865 [Bacillus thuringiensis]PFH66527.1 hypothetical protein COI56_27715 [Bacillus thuringiensis]